ncbi:TIGR02996 domain-containing protein [Frigoriglobus tundricola]|nr:TIGR02996 domain-containing protein [Frigoriglobus tundricola]
MSDGEALLSVILAQPDEDVPRLVYADWLDENGTESDRARAEFVRVQVALAGVGPTELVPWNQPVVAQRGREKLLLAAHGANWLAPLRAPGGPLQSEATHGQFRRGFVEVVWMPAAWFAVRADVLFARVPVRELRVTRATAEELAALVAHGHFPRLRSLELSDQRLGDSVALVLTRQPAVAALTRLRLRGCGLTDAGACRLADADFDWPLRELDVSLNSLSPYGVAALRARFGEAIVCTTGAE